MRVRSCIVILVLVFPALATADIVTGLVGHWAFDGDATDSSGNLNDGIVLGATLTADRFGNPDSAYLFDGLSSRINVPSSASLESPTTEITMAAWIRRDGWGLVGQMYNPILTKSTGTPNAFQYRFIITPSGMGTAFNNWNTSVAAPSEYDAGVWYHVASTWDGITVTSYLNGVAIHNQALAPTINVDNRTLSIGSDIPGILEIFLGAIDDLRIYNRALTAADIAELAGVPTSLPIAASHRIGLGAAFPNPLHATTILPWELNQPGRVQLEVFDLRGRRVRELVNGSYAAGRHVVTWDGRDASGQLVPSGTYFYRLVGSGEEFVGKAIVRR